MLELLEQQKSLTINQWKIFTACLFSIVIDFFDFALIGFVLAFFVKDWHLTFGQSGAILFASGIAAIPGGIFFGWLGDKIGRRKVFMMMILTLSLATGVMALAPENGWLFIAAMRFIVGLGVGGLAAVDLPLLQEFVPASKRGWVSGLSIGLLPLGPLLAALFSASLGATIGWRGLFAIGLVPAAFAFVIRLWVPELPRWLFGQGRFEEARRSLAWALKMDPATIQLPATLPVGAACVVARAVQISAQHRRRDHGRAEFDGRRWRGAVGRHPARAGAEGDARPGRIPVGMDRSGRDSRAGPRRLAVGWAGTPPGGGSALPCLGRCDGARRLSARRVSRQRVDVLPAADVDQLFLERQLLGRLSLHGGAVARAIAGQRVLASSTAAQTSPSLSARPALRSSPAPPTTSRRRRRSTHWCRASTISRSGSCSRWSPSCSSASRPRAARSKNSTPRWCGRRRRSGLRRNKDSASAEKVAQCGDQVFRVVALHGVAGLWGF